MSIPQSVLPIRGIVTSPDLADDPRVFPHLRGQQWPKRGPQWSTTALKSKSGRTFRKQNCSYPTWVFSVAYSSLSLKPTRMERDRLINFFNQRAGQFGDFFYYDPYDNIVSGVPIGTGNGFTTQFQLTRVVQTWSEPVFALNGPPTVTVAGAVVSNYSIPAPGVILFNSPPAAGAVVAWSGSFLFWCHFTQDELDTQQLNAMLWSNDGLTFETVRA